MSQKELKAKEESYKRPSRKKQKQTGYVGVYCNYVGLLIFTHLRSIQVQGARMVTV